MPLMDDPELLEMMRIYSQSTDSNFQAGTYWKLKTVNAYRELKRAGIAGFRGDLNGAGSSYGDNPLIDLRKISNYGRRSFFIKFSKLFYPFFTKFFDAQVLITKEYFEKYVYYRSEYLKNLPRVKELLSRYEVPTDSIKGECLDKGVYGGKIISNHYLRVLDTLDHLNQIIDFKKTKSMFEIGGGFGANVHLTLSLYPNIKKVVYLDIPPNLYVGTQYLKSFYGKAVIDYRQTKSMDVIRFSDNDQLEILCLTPSQIERFEGVVDYCHNANSFVEMSENTVYKYSDEIERILGKNRGIISMVSYDGFTNSTINPTLLPKFFNREFTHTLFPTLSPGRFNHHFISISEI